MRITAAVLAAFVLFGLAVPAGESWSRTPHRATVAPAGESWS